VEQRDQGTRAGAGDFDAREIVVAFAVAGVDRIVVRAVGFDDLAEGGKGGAGERLGAEDAVRPGVGTARSPTRGRER
jgi:hypothetical protein